MKLHLIYVGQAVSKLVNCFLQLIFFKNKLMLHRLPQILWECFICPFSLKSFSLAQPPTLDKLFAPRPQVTFPSAVIPPPGLSFPGPACPTYQHRG